MNDKSHGRPMGPNAKALLSHFIAREAVPPGGGIDNGLRFFTDSDYRAQVTRQALGSMNAAIEAVKSAPDNPYGTDEEAIAAAILKKIERRSHP